MEKGTNIMLAIHHLKTACDFLQDFQREHPGTNGSRLFKNYEAKVRWIFSDLLSNPNFSGNHKVIDGIKQELKSDPFTVPAIMEKVYQLQPDKREILETIIDSILSGEEILIEKI